MAELLIKNGRILDPGANVDFIGDILVDGEKIREVGKNLDAKADTIIDASGFLVTPGWIDIHGHLYEGGAPNGFPIDLASIPMGITAIVDAGSSGVANYPNLLKYLRNSIIRAKLMLNVSACGIIMPSHFPEPLDPKVWNINLFRKAKEICGEDMIGLKVRVSKDIVRELGLEPLKKAVEAADKIGTRVIVHVTDAPVSMSEVAACLRMGDVFCHVFHGKGNTIITPEGKIEEGILEARKRGVIFDAASGRGNFGLDVARTAIAEGFLPDSISTDITLQNLHNLLAGHLPIVMSRYLPLGMSVEQIIECVTKGPAEQFGMEGLGTLATGTAADITIAELVKKPVEYVDAFGKSVTCKEIFAPKATIIGGTIQYRSVDCHLLRK
jgi:predicted amidohydrolase